jgi:lysophospholipase L1-like esterase
MRACSTLLVTTLTALALLGCGDSVEGGSPAVGAGGGSTGSGVGGSGGGGAAPGPTAKECLAMHHWPFEPDYDQFAPTLGAHCQGTNHQAIEGVEKLVFLGDSITEGTPPTQQPEFYRTVLADGLTRKFPGLEVAECAANGARIGDLLATQIPGCFPAPEPKRTLVVMTIGGNDVVRWPEQKMSAEQALADAEALGAALRQTIGWFRDDPMRFPAGVFVAFANVYEFTDGTADLGSCPGASFLGLSGEYPQGGAALKRLAELYMKTAVETKSDMIFMLEAFCGHGWKNTTMNSCYLGPGAANWFDFTCIHPDHVGHGEIAKLFRLVVDE